MDVGRVNTNEGNVTKFSVPFLQSSDSTILR